MSTSSETPVVQSVSTSVPNIDKLEGQINYSSWKFAMKMSLMLEGLWDIVNQDTVSTTEKEKDNRALAKICLSVKPLCYVHLCKVKSSNEAWKNLQNAFEATDMNQKFELQRRLFRAKRDNYETMEEYINDVISIVYRLADIGVSIKDDFVAFVLLNGLNDEYEALVMALTYNDKQLSSEEVKTKLLAEDCRKKSQAHSTDGENALYTRSNRKFTKGKIICFNCGEPGHKKPVCPKNNGKNRKSNEEKGKQKKFNNKKQQESQALLTTAMVARDSTYEWIIDSGATSHMSMRKDWMINLHQVDGNNITTANGEKIIYSGAGNVAINLNRNGNIVFKTVTDVAYVPSLTANLLSVSKMVEKGHVVVFNKNGCTGYMESTYEVNGDVTFTGSLKNGLYFMDQSNAEPVRVLFTNISNHTLWHKRLGHLNHRGMDMLKNLVTGMNFAHDSEPCLSCIQGKQTVNKFPKNKTNRAKELLELVHSDLVGPMEEVSLGGAKYCLTFVDDYSRKVFGFILKSKKEVLIRMQEFLAFAENQTGKRLKCLRTDNGSEYVNRGVENFLKSHGIIHQTTISYTPQQNGVAERTNRTLIEKSRCLLFEAKLSKKYWAEAMNTAIYLKNRSPTAAVKDAVPEEVWTGKKIDLSHLRIFGCRAQVHVPKQKRKKFDSKSNEYMMVGYCETSKGYRLIDVNDPKKVIKARNVIFLENEKPSICGDQLNEGSCFDRYEIQQVEIQALPPTHDEVLPHVQIQSNDESEREYDADLGRSSSPESYDIGSSNNSIMNHDDNVNEVQPERRYPLRDRKPKIEDYMEYSFMANNCNDPIDIENALSRSDGKLWREAVYEELKALADNKTWELVSRPTNKNIVKCKWVFKRKVGADGEIQRYKARLVAKGFSQKFGEDYFETFAPVVRISTVRLLFGLAAELDLEIDHIDITTAFLNGDLQEDIYMEQPPGFIEPGNESKVCKLQKALYGLKQSARSWNNKIDTFLINAGFKRCTYDNCVYTKNNHRKILIIALHVDDFYIFFNDQKMSDDLKIEINRNFKMKDLGKIKECLGMRVIRDQKNGKISLDQKHYTETILKKFGMFDTKPVSTPMETNVKLVKASKNEDIYPYQELIGALMYLSVCTRPDIAHTTSFLSQFNNCHDKTHWTALKRVLKYLRGTLNIRLTYVKSKKPLEAYVDADWGNCIEDRHSYTGYVLKYAGAAVSWQSSKQRSVALSTTEAEYMALCEGA